MSVPTDPASIVERFNTSPTMAGGGRRIEVPDGPRRDTGDLMHAALEAALAFRGQRIRCAGIVPGVTMHVVSEEFEPLDAGEKYEFIDAAWNVLTPGLISWLRASSPSPRWAAQLSSGLRFDFQWEDGSPVRPAFFEILVHYDDAHKASYAKTRRHSPLQVQPADVNRLLRQRRLQIRKLLLDALDKSQLALDVRYGSLPIPVRYRVTGALSAWQTFRGTFDSEQVRAPLEDELTHAPMLEAMTRMRALFQVLLPNGLRGLAHEALDRQAQYSAVWQAFEMRNGSFYEPSAALHRLIDTAQIADSVPVGMISLPTDTLCILPKAGGTAGKGAGNDLIVIFRTEKSLDFIAWSSNAPSEESTTHEFRLLSLGNDAPHLTIDEALNRVFGTSESVPDSKREAQEHWRAILDYAVKTLLYLKARDADVVPDRAYSDANRDFSGLGSRRRAERLEEIEQLYDRFIVGPAVVDKPLVELMPAKGEMGQMPTHWRGPYFKMQHHGPRNAHRKLVFVGPSIVRADRLGGMASSRED